MGKAKNKKKNETTNKICHIWVVSPIAIFGAECALTASFPYPTQLLEEDCMVKQAQHWLSPLLNNNNT